MEDGERTRGQLIASPVFVLSVAVLLANDHVLKAAWPGLITGKLSDVAGVSMVAVLLTAAFARPSIGFGVTAISFALLKTVPLVAILAAPVLGGVTRPTRRTWSRWWCSCRCGGGPTDPERVRSDSGGPG